jgi:hypothetical protein
MKHLTRLAILLKAVLPINLGILVLVAVSNWLGGWRTANLYGASLITAGAMIIGLAALSGIGSWVGPRDFTFQMSESAGMRNIAERAQQTAKDTVQSFSMVTTLAAAGLISVVIGVALQAVFP